MNATPLIDVVMCLIVFYLIVGKLASAQLAPVDLPRTALGASETEPLVLIVNVLGGGGGGPDVSAGTSSESWFAGTRVLVEGREVATPRLLAIMINERLAEQPETAVQIRGDRRLPFGAVDPVLRACAAAGAQTVRLMSEQSL